MRMLLLIIVVSLGCVGSTQAAVLEYFSQAQFDSAAPNLAIRTFNGGTAEGASAPRPYTYDLLTFASPDSVYLVDDNQYGPGIQYVEVFKYASPSSVTVTLAAGVTAISFYVGTYNGADTVAITVNGLAQTALSTTAGRPSRTFVGFTDTDPITSLTFTNAFGAELDFISFQVDSQSTSVPEPASVALLGAGLVGVGVARRRRTA